MTLTDVLLFIQIVWLGIISILLSILVNKKMKGGIKNETHS